MDIDRIAYNRRLTIEGVILVVLALFLAANHANAQGFNVSHNGVPQFCTLNLQVIGSVYNFVNDCSTPPPPQNELTRANVLYVGHDAAPVANVDLTQWSTVWGRIQANQPPLPWPATRGATPQWVLGRSQFTCTRFHTTATTGANVLAASSYNTASNFDASISRTCGDFTTSNGNACLKSGVTAFASTFMTYGPGTGTNYYCHTDSNSDYYLNLRWTGGVPVDPNPSHPLCTSAGCKIAVQSNTSPN